jgi:hypothetical protein
MLNISNDELELFLKNKVNVDIISQNTTQEIKVFFNICKPQPEDTLYFVSSPTHVVRVFLNVLTILQEMNLWYLVDNIQMVVSDTSYANRNISDLVVVEPPHRGDNPDNQFYVLVKKAIKLYQDNVSDDEFEKEFLILIEKYSKTD